jgi:hypothetical protein
MLISLTTLLAILCSIFRSRAALQLENLALRHQIGVLQRSGMGLDNGQPFYRCKSTQIWTQQWCPSALLYWGHEPNGSELAGHSFRNSVSSSR